MSTGSSTLAARRGGLPWLRTARIRLAGLLLVPLLAVVVLATVRLVEVSERARDAGRAAEMVELGADLTTLTGLLHAERMAALQYLAEPDSADSAYRAAMTATDGQTQTYRERRSDLSGPPQRVRDRLAAIDEQLAALSGTRTLVAARAEVTVTDAAQRYSTALATVVGYDELVAPSVPPGEVADNVRALGAFSRAAAAVGEQEAAAYVLRVAPEVATPQQWALGGARQEREAALAAFRAAATPAQTAAVESLLRPDATKAVDDVSTRLAGPSAVPPAEIVSTFGDLVERTAAAEQQLERDVVRLAADADEAAYQRAAIEYTAVLVTLLAAIGLAVLLGRSLYLSLRRLREAALAVAHRDLPDAVTRLRDVESLGESAVDEIVRDTHDPIRILQDDEFGQVAQAFNTVHREAIRIAAEQAALRASVSAMFLSLARRSQALVDRMIGELDDIEHAEEDPKRLARLFELDHLATRMRRNDENLLVLAGAEVGAARRDDALLVDVLRAAQSEVEHYHRIEFGPIDTDVSIMAGAVNDVVRLLAELLDNATRFSAPTTVVVADGHRAGDQVVVRVEDRGLGISAEQLEVINRRLAEPGTVDIATFRLMGFAVVSRLAARHRIRVEMRANRDGGTTAMVTIPASVVITPETREVAPARPAPRLTPATLDIRPEPAPLDIRPEPAPLDIRREPAPIEARPATRLPGVLALQAPPVDLDLAPTPDRPPLPTRVPKNTAASPDAAKPAETAGQPADNGGWGAALASLPPVPPLPTDGPVAGSRTESPIFVEMQHSWFALEPGDAAEQRGIPTAGYAPSPDEVTVRPALPPPPEPSIPKPRTPGDERWRTAADEGWSLAIAAAAPPDAGTTHSGLPKRIPQAQLVPGGVQTAVRTQKRRNPDDVRGLLSAYHRGVQRGRTEGVAEAATGAPSPQGNDRFLKENEQ